MRVDGVMTPPGWFRPGATWTLIRTDRGFWMVNVGTARRSTLDRDSRPERIAHATPAPSRSRRATAPEIDVGDLGGLAAAGRASFHPWSDVTAVSFGCSSLRGDGAVPVARLRCPERLRLEFTGHAETVAREFFEPVAHLVGWESTSR